MITRQGCQNSERQSVLHFCNYLMVNTLWYEQSPGEVSSCIAKVQSSGIMRRDTTKNSGFLSSVCV